MMDRYDVYIVDDDASIRDSLTWMFDAARLKSKAFASGEEFLKFMLPGERGSLVLDLDMPGATGLDVLRALGIRGETQMRTIVVTGSGDLAGAVQCIKLGATDVLEKPLEPTGLVARVRAAVQQLGERPNPAVERVAICNSLQQVSDREKELLALICQGYSNKQLASKLRISAKTVANHRAHIISKMGAENTADLVRKTMLAEPSLLTFASWPA